MRNSQQPNEWDENLLARILDSFREAMKLEVRLFPLQGKAGIRSLRGNGHPYCRAIRGCAQGRRNCLTDINRAVQLSMKTGEPYIFQCHADMIEFTAAVRDGDGGAAAFVCGPILLRHPDAGVERGIDGKLTALGPEPGRPAQTPARDPRVSGTAGPGGGRPALPDREPLRENGLGGQPPAA